MSGPRANASVRAGLGALLLVLLMLPSLRTALEASMSLHMLAQFPALMLAGALLGAALPRKLAQRLRAWNVLGISGLATCLLVLAVLMIPRVLDLALLDPRVEFAKLAALLFAGALLPSSWRASGLVVQGFALGNLLPMMVIVGTLYQDSPLRLCNGYRIDDQKQLGLALVWVAVAAGVTWLAQVLQRLSTVPEKGSPPTQ